MKQWEYNIKEWTGLGFEDLFTQGSRKQANLKKRRFNITNGAQTGFRLRDRTERILERLMTDTQGYGVGFVAEYQDRCNSQNI